MNEQTDQEPTRVVLEKAEYSPPSDDYLREQILALPAGESTFDLCGAEGKRGAGARRSVEAGGGQEVRGEPHSDGDASAPGVELGDTSEDTRRGDGLDGQRPPPFCGPHGESTPEPSWNRTRALVSETHRRPSRRPFDTHPTLYPYSAPHPSRPPCRRKTQTYQRADQ